MKSFHRWEKEKRPDYDGLRGLFSFPSRLVERYGADGDDYKSFSGFSEEGVTLFHRCEENFIVSKSKINIILLNFEKKVPVAGLQ